jgi:hypothetical protein
MDVSSEEDELVLETEQPRRELHQRGLDCVNELLLTELLARTSVDDDSRRWRRAVMDQMEEAVNEVMHERLARIAWEENVVSFAIRKAVGAKLVAPIAEASELDKREGIWRIERRLDVVGSDVDGPLCRRVLLCGSEFLNFERLLDVLVCHGELDSLPSWSSVLPAYAK